MSTGIKSKIFFCAILAVGVPAQALWRQTLSRTISGIATHAKNGTRDFLSRAQQYPGALAFGVAATVGTAGFVYTGRTPVAQAIPQGASESSPKSNAVVLWGINNVLFKPPQIPRILHVFGITTQTFKNILYKDLQKIPESEIPEAKALAPSAEPPLMVAWLTSRISCQQAKEIVLKHTEAYSFSRFLAKSALTPEDLIQYLCKNEAILVLVNRCKCQGAVVGLSSSVNGEVFDVLQAKHQFLKTDFDVQFVSGKRGLMTSDPSFYDDIVRQFPHKKIYLIDAPGLALVAAQKKGIIPIAFVASSPRAIEDLTARLQAEGLFG